MTTTNNHLTLIDQVGGIEKAKEIVETHPFCYMPHTFKYWSKELDDYVLSTKYATVLVDDLRIAIEHHYYGRSEAEELAAYAELSQEKIEGGAMLVGDFSEARKKVDQLSGISREFKVGDLVVVIINALGNKFTWEVVGLSGCMIEISQIGQPNEWVHYAEIAHATPSEIKAGRRLDHSVDVTDTVTDIHNHISPNTKVVEL